MKKEKKTKPLSIVLDIFAFIIFTIIVIGSISSIILIVERGMEFGEEAVIEHINSSDEEVVDAVMWHLEDKYTTTKLIDEDIEDIDDDIDYLKSRQRGSSDEIDAILEYLNLELYTEKVKAGCVLCKEFSSYCENPDEEFYCVYEEITKVRKIK